MSKAEDRYLEHFLDGRLRNCSSKEAFLLGYHQAEKDLDISWVKEVSGVKEMKRAKEEALKAYPPRSIAANYDTIARRDAFEYGYLKAEQDNALTWEDMMIIHKCIKDAMNFHLYKMMEGLDGQKIVYEEVLKRFKKLKEKLLNKNF